MDHSHMDHSGMDMSAHRCNMNVRSISRLVRRKRERKLTQTLADALHLEHARPLHRLPLVARQRHALAHHLSPGSRRPWCCLRSAALCVAKIRDIRGQEAGGVTE